MSIRPQPAIPAALPRTAVQRDRDHLMSWLACTVSALAAAISVLVVAVMALALGIT
jgi:hypothetical protein